MPNLYQNNPEKCCGCSACYAICPVNAITLQADSEGFLYPTIDKDKCIECNACIDVCPIEKEQSTKETSDFYAVKHTDEDVIMKSSSGGMFTAISDYILENGGVVYGAVYDENLKVKHARATTKEERDAMRVSKYTQSDMGDIFGQVKNDLISGKTVLFTGTPCQASGLYNFLRKDYDNLYTLDLVCHGTPSPLMFEEHIKNIEKTRKSKVKKYVCRYKGKGWHYHVELAEFENGKIEFGTPLLQEYKTLFYTNLILRPSCYDCKFANLYRPSDLTLADFWGIEKCMPDWDDQKGTSMILVNNEKGERLFDAVSPVVKVRKSESFGRQPNLEHPTQKPADRKMFWELYKKRGFRYITARYGRNNLKTRLKYFVKNLF